MFSITKMSPIAFLTFLLISLPSCDKDTSKDTQNLSYEEKPPPIGQVFEFAHTANSIKLYCEVKERLYSITEYGFCCSPTNKTPTINDINYLAIKSINIFLFDFILSDLKSETTYYVRSYSKIANNVKYSDQVFSFTTLPWIKDNDNNVYNSIKYQSKIWFLENLKTTKLNDGSPIALVTDNNGWSKSTIPSYCYYDNNFNSYGKQYGALYNGYAINTKKLCPSGWHVSSESEWSDLFSVYNSGQLQETGSEHWTGNYVGNNYSMFTALPGGSRWNDGSFGGINIFGNWWRPDSFGNLQVISLMVNGSGSGANKVANSGLSVRCIKD